MVLETVRRTLDSLRSGVSARSIDDLSGDQAARMVDLCTEIERIAAAARTLAARRVERSKVWQRSGYRTAAQWVASKTGTTVGNAIGMLEAARHLEELPRTREAFFHGKLSETQARDIAGAAFLAPEAEGALLRSAPSKTVAALREECRTVRADAMIDEAGRYELIRRSRYLRHWIDEDGAVRLHARLTPDAGALLIGAIEARRDRIAASARASGDREPSEAHAADALVELAEGGSGPRAMVHVIVDQATLAGASKNPGRTCEIPGFGRIPLQTARSLAGDAIVKVIEKDGPDIRAVRHLGRTIPARVRTALEVRDPTCVVPGCHERRHLEIDHYKIAFADGGESRLENLARLCKWHHYQKTHLGYRLGGGPGRWRWRTPDDLEGAVDAPVRPP